jgi:hypothetical protein
MSDQQYRARHERTASTSRGTPPLHSNPPVFAASSVAPPSPIRFLWWAGAGLALVILSAVPWGAQPEVEASRSLAPAGVQGTSDSPAQQPSAAPALAPRPAADEYEVRLSVVPASAELRLDNQLVGTGTLTRSFLRDGTTHLLGASAADHRTEIITFRDAPPPGLLQLEPAPMLPPAAPTRSR